MALRRVGVYYYFFPTFRSGKRIIWDGIDADGFRTLDHVPKEAESCRNDTEMKIGLGNGSIIQVIGTDRLNSVVGPNPVGCVFSEFALQDPQAWNLVRPILRENKGWAVFNFTPRGKNHGYELFEMAKQDPGWFCQLLTVHDTKRPNGEPIISDADIQQDRREGMPEDLIQQEYFCSFNASLSGAYYGKLLDEAEQAKRIGTVNYDPAVPVYTAWDLGVGDSTAIWFLQAVGSEFHFIDYYEASGEGISHYAKILQEKPYVYREHLYPHDAKGRELGTGKSLEESAAALGIRPIRIVPMLDVEDGINASRLVLPRCWFDAEKCKRGLEALKSYRKDYNDKLKEFKSTPLHDWASHGADAFRYFAVGFHKAREKKGPPNISGSGWMG